MKQKNLKNDGKSREKGSTPSSNDITKLKSSVKKISRKINYSADVINYIEKPSRWTKPVQISGYALKSTVANNSGNYLRGQFLANKIFHHWSLGKVAVSFSRPYIYPGHKCLYFPIRYLTEDGKLYREIAIFKVDHEPTQIDADNFYVFIIFSLELYDIEIKKKMIGACHSCSDPCLMLLLYRHSNVRQRKETTD